MQRFEVFAGRRKLILPALLCLAILSVFWPLTHHDFVAYDDDIYVTDNPNVQQGLSWRSLGWALTTTHAGNWHPLTWLSHMADCQAFGLNPAAHHSVNLLLHLGNTSLLFWLLANMTAAPWLSALVAALFALHPLHVESVAWVAERKDLLSTLLFLLTLLAWVHYTRQPVWKRYWPVLTLFVAGLMAKPMLVTLPFVLLLLDFWPLRRLQTDNPVAAGRLLWEKIPLCLLSVVSSVVTVLAQHSAGAVQTLQDISAWGRLSNVLISYTRYLQKTIWPTRLAVFYPHPGNSLTGLQVAGATLLLAAISALAVATLRRRPYLLAGWLWYLGTLVPVIGIVQVGAQAMADRYSYIPLIGLFVALSWTLADLSVPGRLRWTIALLSVLALLALAALARIQVSTWRNSQTLFDHAIQVVPNNYVAHNNLGFLLAQQGLLDSAIAHYRTALHDWPRYADAHNNLGAALAAQGKNQEAMQHYVAALQIRPDYVESAVNIGIELASRGESTRAIEQFGEALRSSPQNAKAHYNLALVLAGQGKFVDAVGHYRAALRLRPSYAQAHINLGVALAALGNLDEAVTHYREALRLKPDSFDARINLGIELARQGDLNAAIEQFSQAVRLNPDSAQAHFNLAHAYLLAHNRAAALQEYQALVPLNPALSQQLEGLLGQ